MLIKALTISQPWASLIASGAKRIENRSWTTGWNGPLAIHAGGGRQYLDRFELSQFDTGAIIAICRLRAVLHLEAIQRAHRDGVVPRGLQRIGFTIGDLTRILHDKHAEGPFCWILEGVRQLPEPIPLAGQRGLWTVRHTQASQLERLYREISQPQTAGSR